MKVGVIGVGQAGGRIADLLTYHSLHGKHRGIVPFSLAVNSAQADLQGLKSIAEEDRILVGQTIVKGHGAGLNRKVGAQVTRHSLHTVMHPLTDGVLRHVDAFLVIASLGGGTGSGGAPVIISKLREVYDEPTYFIGIIPSEDEGGLMTMNAIECIREVDGLVNGILLFDNDIWRKEGRALETSYGMMNDELVKPLPLMLAAGETRDDRVGIKVVDSSDIINSWDGFAYIGVSEMKVKKPGERFLLSRKRSSIDQLNPAMRCYTAIRNAATLRLTGECDIKEAKRALMILAGPPDQLSMEGFSQAKSWLEDAISTSEVRGGDCPIRGWDLVVGLVLLSGYKEIPRLGVRLRSAEVKMA
jgi:tubulin-like protein CetZ